MAESIVPRVTSDEETFITADFSAARMDPDHARCNTWLAAFAAEVASLREQLADRDGQLAVLKGAQT